MQDYYLHIRLTTARLTSVLDNLRGNPNADPAWILVLENVSIAEIFAKKYAKYLSDQCDQQSIYDDFFQAALLDMHKAAERFDPSRGTKFSTFASHYAKGAVQKAYRDIVRHGKVETASDCIEDADGESWDESCDDFHSVHHGVVSKTYNPRQSAAWQEENHQFKDALCQAAVRTLSERDRRLMELRFGINGKSPSTFQEIGEAFGFSAQRAHILYTNIMKDLQKKVRAGAA